ncbi:MAG: aspartyl protease family protein, partial [Sphingomicrobium sp.]
MTGSNRSLTVGVGVLVLIGAAALAHPGHSAITPPRVAFAAHSSAIPVDLFRGSRIFVAGTINGRASSMMLDSGAAMTVVDSRFAESIGLTGGEALN